MKKRNVAAAVVLATVIGAATLTACNGSCAANKQGVFNFPDYTVSIDSPEARGLNFSNLENVRGAYSGVVKTAFTGFTLLDSLTPLAKVTSAGGKYSLYDVESGKELFTGLSALNSVSRDTVNYFEMVSKENSVTTYRYAGPDGKLLVNKAFKNPSSFVFSRDGTGYVGGLSAEIYTAVYPSDEDYPQAKARVFFAKYTQNGSIVWREVAAGEIVRGAQGAYGAGETVGMPKNYIYDAEKYPACDLKGYYYTLENGNPGALYGIYTFYAGDGRRLSSVTLYDNCSPLAFTGNYFYYYELSGVREDSTKHYNCEFVTEYNTFKANYVLYRYDFINGGDKSEEIDTDYVVLTDDLYGFGECIPLYNRAANRFDRFLATGAYLMQDNIAVIGGACRTYKIVFDENMAICADLSVSELNFSEPVYRLSDNRYLSGNKIFDGNCRVIAQLPAEGQLYVWAEQGLIMCGNRMLVDYDGKVVVPQIPEDYEVYGDSVYANSAVYNRRHVTGASVDGIVPAGDGETVTFQKGVILKRVSSGSGYAYYVYDLSGKQIGSIENVSDAALNLVRAGEKLVYCGREPFGGSAVWIIK